MLRAGFARLEITPGPELGLLGYEFRQQELPPGSAGVLDPLFARVLVLHDGNAPAAIVSLDLALVDTNLARRLRRAVAAKLRSDPGRVLLACTHTHSGPLPTLSGKEDGERGLDAGSDGRLGISYAHFLQARLEEAAAQADGLLYPVRAAVQSAPLGLGYDRRVPLPPGELRPDAPSVKHCWGPQEFPQLRPGAAADAACTVLALRQEGGPRQYLVWGLGAHGVCLGKTSRVVSADWMGRACALLEAQVPGARGLFLQGASGDVHPWIATQEDPAQLETVARPAAGMVALLLQAAREIRGPSEGSGPRLRLAASTWRCGTTELDLAVWRLAGADLAGAPFGCWLAAAPVELFSELGLDFRRRLGELTAQAAPRGSAEPLLIATLANGWTGYWPTRRAFGEGGYEVRNAEASGRKAGDGERLVEELLRLAQSALTGD